MSYYYWLEFFFILVIDTLFYILVRIIAKSSFVAFCASLIASVNYFGNFDMYCCISRFQERTIVVPFLILSLIFLQIFLEKSKIKYFLWSIFFYVAAFGLAHFSLLFTAPYVFYPIFWYLFNKKKKKIRGCFIGLSYAGISLFFLLLQRINEAGLESSGSIVQYLLHPEKSHYLEYMLRQLVYWSQYPIVVGAFFSGNTHQLHSVPSVINAITITPYVALIYFLVSVYLYIKLPKYRALLLTIICSVGVIFFLNAWFGQYVIAQQVGTNRYLYFPSFLLAIFWTLFLWSIFWKQKSLKLMFIAIFILAGFYKISTNLVNDALVDLRNNNKPSKTLTDYFVNNTKHFGENSLVIGTFPAITLYEGTFYTEQVGKGEVRLVSEDDSYIDLKQIASSSAHVVKLSYDPECGCAKEEKLK